MFQMRKIVPLAPLVLLLGFVSSVPGRAADVVAEWATVKTPRAPPLKSVTVDPKITALLMLDFLHANCGVRPRCIATLPAVRKLLAEARAHAMTIIYTTYGKFTAADTLPEVAPQPGEPTVNAFVDKFVLGSKDTGLEKMLRDKGVTTLIAVGSAANGAVLYTSSAASLRGFNTIVPVDGISAADPFAELITVWQLANGPIMSSKITLTRIDMIEF